MPDTAFLAALLAGLTGGVHCLAMCGGFVTASAQAAVPLLPARRLALERAVTQAGRLATYATLGAALGSVGGAAFALDWPAWQRVLYTGANLALLLTAAIMLGVALPARPLEAVGLALVRRVGPAARPLIAGRGLRARFALGMLWGLTPCGLIYGVLPLALLAGGPIAGAAIMTGLWLGTLPALLLGGGVLRRVLARMPARWPRLAAATMVGAFAAWGLYRAWAMPGAAGPFCLVPGA